MMNKFTLVVLGVLFSVSASSSALKVSTLGSVGMFQQQVKSKVGKDKAVPIVEESHFSFLAKLTFVKEGWNWGGVQPPR